MKRLISAKDVEAAAEGSCLKVDANTIVTAQARDLAKERGVKLCREGDCDACGQPASASCETSHEAVAPAAEAHACHVAPEPHGHEATPALSACEMEKVIRAALEQGIWTEAQLERLLGKRGEA